MKRFIVANHYSQRLPQIMYAFGLFKKMQKTMVGVITFGLSPSEPLQRNCVWQILELNRIALIDHKKNLVSWWIAACLKQLPRPSLIISFADPNQEHIGYVYQASNWIYTGLSTAVSLHLVDGKIKHDRHVNKEEVAEQSSVLSIPQKPKHRYLYPLASNKHEKKEMINYVSQRFGILPYPKGESKHYTMEDERAKKKQLERDEGFNL